MKQLTADEKIRMQCQAREDYEHDRATLLRQGREEGRKEERTDNIRKLADYYMEQNSDMTEKDAMEMARRILE